MKHHKFSEIWQPMTCKAFERFKADILANGLIDPILTYEDKILDGRNRQRACDETGRPAWFGLPGRYGVGRGTGLGQRGSGCASTEPTSILRPNTR